MAEEVTQPAQPSLGRYIVIALVFVLIFIGLAYLAFRISRGQTDVAVRPTPSPTASYSPVTPSVGQVYPVPVISPQPALNYIPSFTPIVRSLPYPKPSPTGNIFIVYDGQGNILSDRPLYTHPEHTAITLEQLRNTNRLALAQEQAKLSADLQRQRSELEFNLQKARQEATTNQQRAAIDGQIALQKLRNELALAQLASQRFAFQQQLANQPGSKNSVQLIQAQAEAQKQLITAQAAGQVAVTQAKTERDTTLATLQAQSQLAQLAYNVAIQSSQQQYALQALKVQALATQAIEAQRAKNQKGLIRLQAELEQEFLVLRTWLAQLEQSPGYYPNAPIPETPSDYQSAPYPY